MSRVEDELRAAMRERDAEAPTAAGFRFHAPVAAPRHRFRWVPAVAAAACVAIVIGIVVGLGPDHQARNRAAAVPVLDCPSTAPTAKSQTDPYPLPTPRTDALAVSDRLVPTTVPVHAVVCAYLHPEAGRLTGSRVVDSGLAVLQDSLGFLPPDNSTGGQPCTTDARLTDSDYYLIGLSYRTGTMWIAAPGHHCLGASNGRFVTGAHVATDAQAAYLAGRWPPSPDAWSHQCSKLSGRPGQDQTLVPEGSVSVVACSLRTSGSRISDSEWRMGTSADLHALVRALDALPTEPDHKHFTCAPAFGNPPIYLAVFTYREGPAVTVTIPVACGIHNGSLQATTDASGVMRIVQRILAR